MTLQNHITSRQCLRSRHTRLSSREALQSSARPRRWKNRLLPGGARSTADREPLLQIQIIPAAWLNLTNGVCRPTHTYGLCIGESCLASCGSISREAGRTSVDANRNGFGGRSANDSWYSSSGARRHDGFFAGIGRSGDETSPRDVGSPGGTDFLVAPCDTKHRRTLPAR